ncbi:MAG: hypothetical protein HPY57_14630 [Ignavibacteria bacterium]|nr:hypothetical protein [Ignavibacteria bacterium]
MIQVILINGHPKSGKDKFVWYCKKYCKTMGIKVYNFSTVDKVKKVAKKLGWDGSKTDEARKFLADMKRIWTSYNDGPFKSTIKRIEKKINERSIFFIHCREPEEIKKFVDYYGDIITTLYLDKPGHVPDNPADKNVKNYKYQHWLDSNVSDDELQVCAENWIDSLVEQGLINKYIECDCEEKN